MKSNALSGGRGAAEVGNDGGKQANSWLPAVFPTVARDAESDLTNRYKASKKYILGVICRLDMAIYNTS